MGAWPSTDALTDALTEHLLTHGDPDLGFRTKRIFHEGPGAMLRAAAELR
jgi:hypothetical protein